MLSTKRIIDLATAPRVRKEAVLKFLGSLDAPAMGGTGAQGRMTAQEARRAYDGEKVFYKYNAATQQALLLGLREHFGTPAAKPKMAPKRFLLVTDGKSWYVRGVRTNERDVAHQEDVYRCDKDFGGPFTLARAMKVVKGLQERAPMSTPRTSPRPSWERSTDE